MSQSGQIHRVVRFVVLGVAVLTVGAGFGRYAGVVEARQQNTGAPYIPPTFQPGSAGDLLDETHRARTENQDRVKGLNEQRQKKLQDDVNKLLALSTELKSDVNKTNKDQLSLDAMRKAAEIEKLAHSIQSRMKS